VNTKGFASFSDYCNIVIGFIGGMTITGLGLVFRVLAFNNGV